MNKFFLATRLSMSVLFLSVVCSSANAQATRTWVSGVGDDVNPCSRTAPCKTFAGAISKTAAGGEINALDPAGYGAVTITKSITIDGGGTMASILAAGTQGVIVNANAASDKVILRNLSINGANTGLNGIKYIAAASLIVQNCHITRFQNSLIDANLTASANLTIDGLTGGFANTAPADAGIRLNTSSGTIRASISNSLLHNLLIGIHIQDNVIATIRNTTMQGNGATSTGVRLGTVAASGSSATHLEGVTISNMNDGVRVTTAGGAVQVSLSNCNILNSLVAASNAGPGATVTSFANNRFANNAADTKGPFTTKAQQ